MTFLHGDPLFQPQKNMEKRQLGGDSQRHLVSEMGDKEVQSTDFQGQGDTKTKAKRKKIGHMI